MHLLLSIIVVVVIAHAHGQKEEECREVWSVLTTEELLVMRLDQSSENIITTGHFMGPGYHDDPALVVQAISDAQVWTGGWDASVIPWNLTTRTSITPIRWPPGVRRHASAVVALAVVDDQVWSGSWDRTIMLWEPIEYGHIKTLFGHKGGVFAITPAADYVFSGSWDKTIRVWERRGEHRQLQTLEGHTSDVWALVATDRYLFSGSLDGTVRIWNLTPPFNHVSTLTPKTVTHPRDNGVYTLALVGQDEVWAGGVDGVVRVWQTVEPFELKHEMTHGGAGIRAMVMCGDRVWTAGLDGLVIAWDITSYTQVATFHHPANTGFVSLTCASCPKTQV